MCNHHEHHHEHKKEKLTIVRVLIAIVIFTGAVLFKPEGISAFLIYLIAYIFAGGDVVLRAFKNILKGEIFDENFLMSIATIGAFAIKEYPEAVMVMVLYQIGEYLQHNAVEKSRRSIANLMNIRPDYANIEINGKLIQKNPQDIKINDIIIVKTGEKIPLDGEVVEGKAVVDTSALTGESIPRELNIGDKAISGSINTNGVLKIRVEKIFCESTVSKILELVEHASNRKAKTENFITKFARYYTPAVVAGAVILAILPPLLFSDAEFIVWLKRALTFLVISCPCALVISIPLGFFGGIGGASRAGILIKGSNYIESLSKPQYIVFDKTGTLTKGNFKVTEINAVNTTNEELLKNAAIAESYSNHPIAFSLKEAYNKPIDSGLVTDVKEISGQGVKATVNRNEILAGNAKLLEEFNVKFEPVNKAGTVIYVAQNREYKGYIIISDEIKSDSKTAINDLKQIVDKTVMLTGDSKITGESVAKELGLDKVYAELLPAQKVEKIEEFINEKSEKKTVIFVGDGINDAPVLTRADVGIAMGALGSDAAIEAADVVIMDDKPSKISTAVKIARKTMRIVKQNIVFALGIKALFLILGAFGIVTMWGAVFADTGVAILAILNSLRTLNIKSI